MSAPITEAHVEAAVAIFAIAMKSSHHGAPFREPCAQLIADSEARAKESLLVAYDVVCEVRNRLTAERDQLRAERDWLKTWQDQAETNYVIGEPLAKKLWDTEAERDRLRAEVERLTAQRENLLKPMRDQAIARAERAEAELANIRALANRRNKQDHSHDTTHQLVASLDQSLDIVQAELAEARWLKGCAIKRSQELLSELAAERARLDWLVKSSDNPLAINLFPSYGWTEVKKNLRASIDAAMKEGTK